MKKVVGGAGFLLAALLAVPLLFFGGSAAASTPSSSDPAGSMGSATAADLTPALPGVPAGGYSTGTFPYGQCTYWAAYNWGGPDHRGVTWTGDAHSWLANAADAGYPTSPTPSVGAIVVWPAGHGYDSQAGHVAIVTAVTPTTYTVSEMHFIGLGKVDHRTVPYPDVALGFISP